MLYINHILLQQIKKERNMGHRGLLEIGDRVRVTDGGPLYLIGKMGTIVEVIHMKYPAAIVKIDEEKITVNLGCESLQNLTLDPGAVC
ncbi:MAG: hypothetical protein UU14_C0052G0004 [Candidatus Roizmanbacteria bacterium GW2011_GWB1_40_7]|uniref:KOW domain-containing protein n=1 Tax=Candidatus Roizmanbacteria bacterium GW2011_GWB1_40_7 TaxID=1618482 RepID=A0A0G0SZV1_9BACT|nr:MAG: hypothetical protein UU14_C0052G0004 [Candidatus Roizmanbacteria bacterium GW2011_GWB1_40_7]